MAEKQPPRVQLNFEPDYDPPPSSINEAEDFASEGEEDEVSNIESLAMPEVVGREKINERDIFADLPTENGSPTPSLTKEPTPKATKEPKAKEPKAKKPRKPMSEEHKAKLALAREKAMAVRKAKAEEKKKMKALENEEKELLKTQKVKRVQKLKKQVEAEDDEVDNGVEKIKQEPHYMKENQRVGVTVFSKKDLEDAQFEAIAKYETLRKQRKAEKKQQQAIEQSKKELLNKLNPQQRQYQYRDGSNRWDMCY